MPVKKIPEDIVVRDKCSVTVEKSLTKNLGNYESARISVAVTLPTNPTSAEISSVKTTIEAADEIVTKELELQVKELLDDK